MTPTEPLRQPEYLATQQYADGRNLGARSNLHDRYGTAPVPFRVWEAQLVTWFDGAEVLEVGTGPGRFWTTDAVPRSTHLTVTDLSPGMVRQATTDLAPAGYASVCGVVCDAQSLPFDAARFDLLVANHMLYHVPDPPRALAEFRRVLRPGGTALIATNAPGHMRQLNEVIAEVLGHAPSGLNGVFGIDNGELMLRDHFGGISWHSFTNPLVVDDADDLAAYAGSLPPASTASPSQRADLSSAFRDRVAAEGGRMRIDTRTGAFVCTGRPS